MSNLNIFFLSVVLISFKYGECLEVGQQCYLRQLRTVGMCTPINECDEQRMVYSNLGINLEMCSYDYYRGSVICCPTNQQFYNTARPSVPITPSSNSPTGLSINSKFNNEPNEEISNIQYSRPVTRVTEKEEVPLRIKHIWPGMTNTIVKNKVGITKRISETKCEEYIRNMTIMPGAPVNETDPQKRERRPPTCFTLSGYVLGGVATYVGEFPFMAAVGWPTGSIPTYKWMCGGTLISERYVLSAGHCIYVSKRNSDVVSDVPTVVRLGDQDLRDGMEDNAYPKTFNIQTIIKHPLYRSPKKYHDLALFYLDDEVEFNYYIRPACLWMETIPYEEIFLEIAGWGVVKQGDKKNSDILQKATIKLYDNETCIKNFELSRNWQGFDDRQLCAGDQFGSKDTCQGDSGGPLIHSGANCTHYVVAVTSFGTTCGTPMGSGIYTKVFNYLDWIEDIVWTNAPN